MTPRQIKLLHAIIDDFINSATAVGSLTLAHRYDLGVSPATIRNEMSDLVELGYLEKPHTSSGRIPTNMAYRFFIEEIMHELDEIETKITANIYEELYQNRFDFDNLIYQTLRYLTNLAQNTAFILLENRVYYAGLSYLADNPEFFHHKDISLILGILENRHLLKKILLSSRSQKSVKILIGEDTQIKGLEKCTFVFSNIRMHGDRNGYLCVFGPTRMNYPKVIPLLDFFSHTLNKVISGW